MRTVTPIDRQPQLPILSQNRLHRETWTHGVMTMIDHSKVRAGNSIRSVCPKSFPCKYLCDVSTITNQTGQISPWRHARPKEHTSLNSLITRILNKHRHGSRPILTEASRCRLYMGTICPCQGIMDNKEGGLVSAAARHPIMEPRDHLAYGPSVRSVPALRFLKDYSYLQHFVENSRR